MRPRAIWMCVALVFAAAACAAPDHAQGLSSVVRVATYNVLNYLEMDRRVEGRFRPAYPKPESEKEAVRRAIREVEPDVLLLQEIGSAPYLEELRQDLAREGLTYRYSHVLEAADPERHVAVLSRIPFARVVPHREVQFTYFGERELVKRGLLELRFAGPAGDWSIFSIHLKSRYTDRPDDPLSETRRVLEARAVRNQILRTCPTPDATPFLVVGDFNDTTGSRTLAAFLARGRTTISSIVPAVDSRGESWTHFYRSEDVYSRVDYVLASPAALPGIINASGVIHDGRGALVGSDHRLVYIDFNQPAVARSEGRPGRSLSVQPP